MAAERQGMSDLIRFGIIGCGGIAGSHLRAIAAIADAEVAAVTDPVPERAQAAAEKFGVARIYPSNDDLLADPQIDAVCICTPSGLHARIAIAALTAGKHVVTEKPMDVTVEACDRLLETQERTGKILTVIHQRRFEPAVRRLKRLIDEGKLGKLLLVDATMKWWRAQSYYDSGDWRGTWELDGGGALMNQGVHTVDLVQHLAGPVTQVFGQIRTAAHERIEVEDIATATLAFESGAVGNLMATTVAWKGFPVCIDVFGTEGMARLEDDRLTLVQMKSGETLSDETSAGEGVSADPLALSNDGHQAQIGDFLRAIRTGTKPLVDGREGRRAVAVVRAVYRSAQTGLPVILA